MNKYQFYYHVLRLLYIIAQNTSKENTFENVSYLVGLKYKLEKMKEDYL